MDWPNIHGWMVLVKADSSKTTGGITKQLINNQEEIGFGQSVIESAGREHEL